MSTFGIICEFNPLHNGHKRLIDTARDMGAERIVCVMSGNAVQRGELAMLDKYDRAKAAVLCGADLVLELPFPWSAASAEHFAMAGVGILSQFCDNIIFGSECGDVELIKHAGEAAAESDFREAYSNRLERGEGAASAYFAELEKVSGKKLSSNDLLGVEYVRAAKILGTDLTFHTVRREGAGYNDCVIRQGEYPSATAIRGAWGRGEEAFEMIPEPAAETFRKCIDDQALTDPRRLEMAALAYFRLLDPSSLDDDIADAEGGVIHRIIDAAKGAKDGVEFFEAVKTKRYTDAKLRRAMLFAMTGVTRSLLRTLPKYTVLLGADSEGRTILAKADHCISVITRAADLPRGEAQFIVGERLESLFTLARQRGGALGDSYRKSPFIKA